MLAALLPSAAGAEKADDGGVANGIDDCGILGLADDGFEPNDTQAEAQTIVAGTPYLNLGVCTGDPDWYALGTIPAGTQLVVALDFIDADGDIDVRLKNAAGSTLDQSISVTDDEEIIFDVDTATELFIEVYIGEIGDVTNSYGMVFAFACLEDGFEDNDTQATATAINVGETVSASTCDNDDDYYSFAVDAGDTIDASLLFDHSQGDLDLQLYNPAGGVALQSNSTTDNESLSFVADVAGTWSVRINPFSTAENIYDLLVQVTPPTCTDDSSEDNDTQAAATALDPDNLPTDLVLCEGDVDWYSFEVSTGDQVFTNYSAGEDDVSIMRLDAQGNPTPDVATADGTWFLKIDQGTAAEVPYDLLVNITPAPCTDDQYEPNNNQASATSLTPGAEPQDTILCPSDEDWFSFPVSAGDDVFVNYSAGALDVSVDLLDSQGHPAPTVAQFDDTYFIRVTDNPFVNEPAGVPYDLIVAITPAQEFCGGAEVTINMSTGASGMGTSGDDVILGTDGADMINGLGGNDIICGKGGADTIDGGPGEDTIFGGNDPDIINGGDDADVINGQGGNDDIFGDDGDDRINGGAGDDEIYGGEGDDDLRGQGNNDMLFGEAGVDQFFGGSGNDRIETGTGGNIGTTQVVRGQGNNDTIIGGSGNDRLEGGPGLDTITGGAGNDVLIGGNAADVLNGGDGNDELQGGGSNDTLNGGNNDDSLHGGTGNDRLNGDAGADNLNGQGGTNDICNGGAGGSDTATSTCETVIGVP